MSKVNDSQLERDHREALANLTATQSVCTSQQLELRTLRRALNVALDALEAAGNHDGAARVRAISEVAT